jgi:hypothetical protein
VYAPSLSVHSYGYYYGMKRFLLAPVETFFDILVEVSFDHYTCFHASFKYSMHEVPTLLQLARHSQFHIISSVDHRGAVLV